MTALKGLQPNAQNSLERWHGVLIDKDINALARFADRHTVLNKGLVVWSGSNDQLKAEADAVESHLHL